MNNCVLAISCMARKNHARTDEALLRLKNIAVSLRCRLVALFSEKNKLREASAVPDDEDGAAAARDNEHAIVMVLRRLATLSKRWDVAELLADGSDSYAADREIEALCDSIGIDIKGELKARVPENFENGFQKITDIWKCADSRLHEYVAESVREAFAFLLGVVAWRLDKEIELIEGTTTEDVKNHIVLCMRERITKLVVLSFELYARRESSFPAEYLDFANQVQGHASMVAGDLRVLFPKKWASAESPLLRACALSDDRIMIGGYNRFFLLNEEKVRFHVCSPSFLIDWANAFSSFT